jgi:hypothetical protein
LRKGDGFALAHDLNDAPDFSGYLVCGSIAVSESSISEEVSESTDPHSDSTGGK